MSNLEGDPVPSTSEPKAKVSPVVFAKEASNSLAIAESHFNAFCDDRHSEDLVATLHFITDAIKAYTKSITSEEWGDTPASPDYLNLIAVKNQFELVRGANPKLDSEYHPLDSWRALKITLILAAHVMNDTPSSNLSRSVSPSTPPTQSIL